MISPGFTASPPNFLIPRYFGLLSLPLRVLPPALDVAVRTCSAIESCVNRGTPTSVAPSRRREWENIMDGAGRTLFTVNLRGTELGILADRVSAVCSGHGGP